MTDLIVGCGYLGRRVGRLLAGRGGRVLGTVRSPSSAESLSVWGIEPVIADVLDPESLAALPEVDRVVYCVGFDRTAGIPMRTVYVEGLRHVLERMAGRARSLVYASSTGVYGRTAEEWVFEETPAEPLHESGRVCLEAEGVARRFGGERGLPAVILRFSGLYGPGRVPRRAALERGEPIASDAEGFLNLIHIDDAAAATVAALDRGEAGRLYHVSDDRPVSRREFYGLAATLLGAPSPRFVPADGEANRRISNRRMRDELGVALAFPDIMTGLPDALRDE